ncbi:TPA: plasmid transfer protein [Klebsiella pneumoniae]|nr:plasmid transfer protein [Klebsiella pneumoniae]HBR1478635.1 plasmid transfer protein [Klebsiella pneumoniae]
MVENLNQDNIALNNYRNEKVFNSGISALELNFHEKNGKVNLILTGSSPTDKGHFDWTGSETLSSQLSKDEVIGLCMVFLRLKNDFIMKDKKTKHMGNQVYKNLKVTFSDNQLLNMTGGIVTVNKRETSSGNFFHKISIDPPASLRLGLFLLSVIQSWNPALPSETVLTCMRLNASSSQQK